MITAKKHQTRNIFWGLMVVLLLISGGELLAQTVAISAGGSPVIINEFVASNGSGLVDEDGDASDWIEIYNRGGQPVNLAGWTLTDDSLEPDKWSFPNLTLHSGEYLVVFASGKDRKLTAPGTELHTNFRLNRNTDFLALYNVLDGRFMDVISPQEAQQVRDVAFGRKQNTAEVGYLIYPSPGSPNNNSFVPETFGISMEYTIRNSEPEITEDALAQALVDSSVPLATKGQLQFTEIMYNPREGDDYEFVELKNISSEPLNLAGSSFEGINFTFPLSTPPVAPGQLLVLVRNETAFAKRYPGVEFDGVYTGQLSNQGETISLHDYEGGVLASVTYKDDYGWPLTPDGRGGSLIFVAAQGNPDDPLNWRASSELNGTPGVDLNGIGSSVFDSVTGLPRLQILDSFLTDR